MQITSVGRLSPIIMMTFGTWLKQEREARGWSQRLLAEKAEISSAMVARLEKDSVGHSPDMISRLAGALTGTDASEATKARIARDARAASAGLLGDAEIERIPDEYKRLAMAQSAKMASIPSWWQRIASVRWTAQNTRPPI